MTTRFYHRPAVLVALTVAGLATLGKDIVALTQLLYQYAFTREGTAALLVAVVFISAAALIVALARR